jgi:hypothetical protein
VTSCSYCFNSRICGESVDKETNWGFFGTEENTKDEHFELKIQKFQWKSVSEIGRKQNAEVYLEKGE